MGGPARWIITSSSINFETEISTFEGLTNFTYERLLPDREFARSGPLMADRSRMLTPAKKCRIGFVIYAFVRGIGGHNCGLDVDAAFALLTDENWPVVLPEAQRTPARGGAG